MRAKNHITHYALYIIMYICVLPVHAQLNQIEVPNRHACDTSLNDLQKDLWNYYDALVETPYTIQDIIKGNDPCYDWIVEHKAQLVDNPAQFKKENNP